MKDVNAKFSYTLGFYSLWSLKNWTGKVSEEQLYLLDFMLFYCDGDMQVRRLPGFMPHRMIEFWLRLLADNGSTNMASRKCKSLSLLNQLLMLFYIISSQQFCPQYEVNLRLQFNHIRMYLLRSLIGDAFLAALIAVINRE